MGTQKTKVNPKHTPPFFSVERKNNVNGCEDTQRSECWGVRLMVRRRRKKGDWHHRVPDFQLVYCGPRKSTRKEETKHVRRKGMVEVFATTDKDGAVVRKLERQK